MTVKAKNSFKAIANYLKLKPQMRRSWQIFVAFVITFLIAVSPALLNVVAEESRFSLRILHTNDHHAHLEPVKFGDRLLGGIARRRTLIEQIRAESKTNQISSLRLSSQLFLQISTLLPNRLSMAKFVLGIFWICKAKRLGCLV